MKKKLLIAVFLIVLLFAASTIYWTIRANQVTFNGSRTRNPDAYTLDFTMMNGEDQHSLVLSQGDSISVDFDIQKGYVDLVIGMEGEDPIYTGNDIDTAVFELTVPKDGTYVITVGAKRAVGYIHMKASAK